MNAKYIDRLRNIISSENVIFVWSKSLQSRVAATAAAAAKNASSSTRSLCSFSCANVPCVSFYFFSILYIFIGNWLQYSNTQIESKQKLTEFLVLCARRLAFGMRRASEGARTFIAPNCMALESKIHLCLCDEIVVVPVPPSRAPFTSQCALRSIYLCRRMIESVIDELGYR